MIEPPRAAPISAAYWRLYITARGSGEVVTSISELEMRATVGGADQCSGGTATASSTNGSNTAAKAVDNSTSTYWATANNDPAPWIWQYAFAVAVVVAELSLTARSSIPNSAPKDFAVQYSANGTDWTTASSFSGISFSSGETKTFAVTHTTPQAPPTSAPTRGPAGDVFLHHLGI